MPLAPAATLLAVLALLLHPGHKAKKKDQRARDSVAAVTTAARADSIDVVRSDSAGAPGVAGDGTGSTPAAVLASATPVSTATAGESTRLLPRVAAAAAPWQSLVADSRPLATGLLFAHLGGMLLAGGLAVAADRQTLRVGRDDAAARARHLLELSTLHRPIVATLGVVSASGVLLALADVETYGTSRVFWAKLALVALLLLNGWRIARAERALRAAVPSAPTAATIERTLRQGAVASIALWLATLLAGVLLTNG